MLAGGSIDRFQVRDLFSPELERSCDSPGVGRCRPTQSAGYFARRLRIGAANAIAADTIPCLWRRGQHPAATLPRVVVVVAAITKIVPIWRRGGPVARAASAPRWTGLPRTSPAHSAPHLTVAVQEVHVVLVDDGRSRAIAEGYAEAFACINCGGCLNFVRSTVRLATARWKAGGRNRALQTWLLDGREAAEQGGASLCIKCGKCRTICPVQLDTPRLLTRLQTEAVTRREAPAFGRAADRLMAALVVHPTLLAGFGSLARAYARTGFQRLVRRTGVLRALKLDAAERLLPPPSTPPAVAPSLAPTAPERARVFFFRGCLSHELLGVSQPPLWTYCARTGAGC